MATYTKITKSEMEDVLFNELQFVKEHNPILQDKSYGEYVYGRAVRLSGHLCSIRVYSSIATGSALSRSVGADAIRVSLLCRDNAGNIRCIESEKRVNRVRGWRKNLVKRVKGLLETHQNLVLCPTCNCPMAKRKGKYGEFWGCVDFPNCRGIVNL